MIKFIIKRLLALIPVLVGVSLLVFFILDLAPGDPAKAALGEQARPEDIEAFRVHCPLRKLHAGPLSGRPGNLL